LGWAVAIVYLDRSVLFWQSKLEIASRNLLISYNQKQYNLSCILANTVSRLILTKI